MARYPNRPEVAELLIELGSDVNLRDGDDKSVRDVNTLLMDTVYPIKQWNVKDAQSFFRSAGQRVKVDHLLSWLRVFEAYRVDGPEIMSMWSAQAFQSWVDDRLADLTRVGITAIALEEETPRWIFELERVYEETRKATKARRKREAEKALAAQRKKEQEAMERLKAAEIRLKNKGLALGVFQEALRQDGESSTDASEGEEELRPDIDVGPQTKEVADLANVGAGFLPAIGSRENSRPNSRDAFRGDPSAMVGRVKVTGDEFALRPGTAGSDQGVHEDLKNMPKQSPYAPRPMH